MAELPINKVIVGNCLEVMRGFPDESIDMVMFSPPYYGLRDYGVEASSIIWGGEEGCEHEWEEYVVGKKRGCYGVNGLVRPSRDADIKWRAQMSNFCVKCGAWRGQLGVEPDWRMYVDHMRIICREVWRVLKREGSMYIVIGDTYFGGGHGGNTFYELASGVKVKSVKQGVSSSYVPQMMWSDSVYRRKCLMLIPFRLAFALIEDGWILRNSIIWYKPNHMPSSVKDRLAQTYEYILFFVKSQKYFYCLDAIRVPHKTFPSSFNLRVRDVKRGKGGVGAFGVLNASEKEVENYVYPEARMRNLLSKLYSIAKQMRSQGGYNGKNREIGSWREAIVFIKAYRDAVDVLEQQESLTEEEKKFLKDFVHNHAGHFLGKNPGDAVISKHDIAVGRVGNYSYVDPMHVKEYHLLGKNPGDFWSVSIKPFKGMHFAVMPEDICVRPILSSCPKDGVVLDPMCGSGTVLVVAKKLGRKYIGIDVNPSYVDIARRRLSEVTVQLDRYF